MNIRHELNSPVSALKTILSIIKKKHILDTELEKSSNNAFDKIDYLLEKYDCPTKLSGAWNLQNIKKILNVEEGEQNLYKGEWSGFISFNRKNEINLFISNNFSNPIAFITKFDIINDKIKFKIINSINRKYIGSIYEGKFQINEQTLFLNVIYKNESYDLKFLKQI